MGPASEAAAAAAPKPAPTARGAALSQAPETGYWQKTLLSAESPAQRNAFHSSLLQSPIDIMEIIIGYGMIVLPGFKIVFEKDRDHTRVLTPLSSLTR